jgi:hypothetical protein
MISTSNSKTQEKQNPPPSSTQPKKMLPQRPAPTALDKAQAVLALWTERCKGSEVCRQYQINWATLKSWEERAMEGMLQALEPQVRLSQGQALSPRLRALLHKQQRSVDVNRITHRLEQLQQNKVANTQPDAAKAAP